VAIIISLYVANTDLNYSQVLSSCSAIAVRRASAKKNNPTTTFVTAVRCEQRDPMTGLNEYFVVPVGKNRGTWQSEVSVDLSSLVQYRFDRISSFGQPKEELSRQRRMKKQEDEKEQMEIKRKAEAAAKQLELERHHRAAIERLTEYSQPKPTINTDLIRRCQMDIQAAFDRHKEETLELLVSSASRGEKQVSSAEMATTRQRNKTAMTAPSNMLRSAGGRSLSDIELTQKIQLAENAAVRMYTERARKKAAAPKPKPKPEAQPSRPATKRTNPLPNQAFVVGMISKLNQQHPHQQTRPQQQPPMEYNTTMQINPQCYQQNFNAQYSQGGNITNNAMQMQSANGGFRGAPQVQMFDNNNQFGQQGGSYNPQQQQYQQLLQIQQQQVHQHNWNPQFQNNQNSNG
jgi:hypothetical protein